MTALSGMTFIINNDIWAYVPNSLKFKEGHPERSVNPQVVGDGAVENEVSENYETLKGSVTVDLKTTTENEIKVNRVQRNFDQNLIKLVSPDGKTRVFENAVVINDPEFDAGADGVVTVEFESKPAVLG